MISSRNANIDIVLKLYQDTRTVFKLADIALLTGENNPVSLAKKLNYYVITGKILNPRKGIYTKPDYNIKELASKLYTPSYISLQYILQQVGVIFQYSESITAISYLSRELEVDGQSIIYRKTKNSILYNWTGISQSEQGIFVASAERAFLDLCYLEPNFYFDNLNSLDKNLLIKLLSVYSSKALSDRVKRIFES
ncbi:MAG: hypothetical protein U9N86_08290 [Bacteroidota bacterium]|nr:hypothetical protein [Bacteroidota bacterium]